MAEPHTFMTDDTLPVLYLPSPKCGHCMEDVEIEDGVAWCAGCRVQWESLEDGEGSVPDPNEDGTEVACGHPGPPAGEPYERRGKRWIIEQGEPCILPAGHTTEHIHPKRVHTTPIPEEVR